MRWCEKEVIEEDLMCRTKVEYKKNNLFIATLKGYHVMTAFHALTVCRTFDK